MSQLIRISTSSRHQSLPARLWSQLRSYTLGPFNLKDKELERLLGESRRTVSGIPVTEANAFTFSAVWDAVNQISSDEAKLPLNLHKRLEGGGSQHYLDSKMYRMLKHEPNPEMGSMVFRRALTAHALTLGNGYAEIERDRLDRPLHLWPLTPDRVKPIREHIRVDGGRWRLGPLQYEIDGGPTILQAKDVIHIQGLGFDGLVGYNVIDKARQAIGLALAAEQFGGAFYANGATFGGILSAEADLDEDQKKDIREVIEKLHSAADKAHRLLVLGAGFKYHKTGVDPNNAQMNETRDKAVEEVARFFNMPLHKLKNLDRSTNNNIEHQGLEYYTGCLLNWLTVWEEELNRKLISPLESRQQFIKHNAMAFLRGAIKDRFEAYGQFLDRGVFCADDVLELEDMNPQPNGQGKIYLVQGAMVPKNQLIELTQARIEAQKQKAKPAPAPAPATPDPAVDEANERATAAEQIADDARRVAAEARAELDALRATATANANELAVRRDESQRSDALAAQLTALSADLRSRADAMAAANEALTADVERQTAAAAAAEERANQAEAERTRCLAEVETASAGAMTARAEADSAVARAIEAEQMAASATTGRADADAARLEAQRTAADAMARADAAEATRAEAIAASERATLTAAQARTEADRLIIEARASADTAVAEQVREAAARAGAEQATLAARQELEQVRAQIAATIVALAAAEEARAEAERVAAEARDSAEAVRVELAREAAARTDAEDAVRSAQQALDLVRAEADSRTAALSSAQQAREDAERLVSEASATAESARADQVREATARASAEDAVRAAQRELEQVRADAASMTIAFNQAEHARSEAERIVTEASTRAAAAVTAQQIEAMDRERVQTALSAAEQELARATTAQREATAAREAAELLVRQSTDRVSVAETQLQEAVIASAESQRAAETASEAARQQVAEAQSRVMTLEAELTAIRTAQQAAESRATVDAEERTRLQQELAAAQQASADRAGAVIAAHRALVIDVMRRMIEREAERARRAQATPEKLRAWIANFYQGHEELCVNALLPVMRVHLAWMGSTADPFEFTRSLVLSHIQESIRQIRAVSEGDAGELAQSLNGLLRRWETDRATAIADRIFQDEIDRVRLAIPTGAARVPVSEKRRRVRKNIERDARGNISGIVEAPED